MNNSRCQNSDLVNIVQSYNILKNKSVLRGVMDTRMTRIGQICHRINQQAISSIRAIRNSIMTNKIIQLSSIFTFLFSNHSSQKDDVMRLFQVCFFLLFIHLFFSCEKDNVADQIIQESAYPDVDEELHPFFEEFEYQAALRGLVVDLTMANIIGKLENLPEEHVAGQCTYGTAIDAEITIDQTFWNDFPQYLIREMVVFHELGHCYLSLGHKEGVHPNGTCLSIMRSGLEDCRDNYNSQTRASYLDELFSLE